MVYLSAVLLHIVAYLCSVKDIFAIKGSRSTNGKNDFMELFHTTPLDDHTFVQRSQPILKHSVILVAPPISDSNPCPIGECVPYFQCANGSIITDGSTIQQIDIRFGGESDDMSSTPVFPITFNQTTNPCHHYLATCCTERLPSTKAALGRKDLTTDIFFPAPAASARKGCGHRNTDGVGFRILGNDDNESQFGELPWTVAILRDTLGADDSRNTQRYHCGGSLIHPLVVLTAAHCVYTQPTNRLQVRAGEWDSQHVDELFGHQDRRVVHKEVHAAYNKGTLSSDIALLFVDLPFDTEQPNVRPVCLPAPDEQHRHQYDGVRCFASGWGRDSFDDDVGRYQAIMKRVELPLVPGDRCAESLRRTRLGDHFQLHRSFLCAGGERGVDTCSGDGGSPLVCPVSTEGDDGVVGDEEVGGERYFQVGIVAWGVGCGDEVPAVYVNVAAFRDWIDDKLEAWELDKSSYIIGI